MQIEKAYFTLGEILARWRIPEADLVYLAENGRLRLSIRVFALRLEFGDYEETAEGERFPVPHEITAFSGLLDLHPHDVFYLFRDGELRVAQFLSTRADYAQVIEDADAVRVRPCSLLVRREERDRFEAEVGFQVEGTAPAMPAFLASEDYHEVRHEGVVFQLGPIQAQVVRSLHVAAQKGDPWRCGKVLLAEAVARFRAGAIWWLDRPELVAAAAAEQDKRYQADAWDDLISRWLTHETRSVGGGYPSYDPPTTEIVRRGRPLSDVSVGEVLEQAIGLEPARWTRHDQSRVATYLKAKGWRREQVRLGSGRDAPRVWRYRLPVDG